MQSGKVKHYNAEKGYGFIDVDNQSEDIFFHISKWKLSQPPQVGQQVYFLSERNDKNQLRATKVTATPNNQSSSTSAAKRHSSSQNQHSRQQNRQHRNQHQNQYQNQHQKNKPKKGILSTVFSLIILLAIAVYAFPNLKAKFFQDNYSANTTTQYTSTSSSSQSTATHSDAITGDPQVDQTIYLIQQGGPFPYPQKDGTTFYNREGRLPQKSRGYYKEYTVPTPGVSHRGARRIVTGGYPPEVYYLTVDHYETFKKLNVEAQ